MRITERFSSWLLDKIADAIGDRLDVQIGGDDDD